MLFNGSIVRKGRFLERGLEVIPLARWPQKVQRGEVKSLAAGLLVGVTGHMHDVWKFEQ